jgi:phospholipid/cholesterol/gamma-HCH transport system substrate-binding protein
MTRSVTEVIVGTAVLLAAALFLWYATQVTGDGASRGGNFEYSASFRSAEGVAVGTDVRMAGVKVGSVTSLDLDPTTFRATARFTVVDAVKLPDDTAVVISSEGLLGGSFVELLPGGSPFALEPGDEILDTQSSVSLVQLLLRFVTGGEE